MLTCRWRLALLIQIVCAAIWPLASPAAEDIPEKQRGLAALADGKFAEAEKILLPLVQQTADAQILQALGQAAEKQGRMDEAWGYYQAAALAKGGETKLPADVKARLRQPEAFASALEKMSGAIVRELAPLARDAKRQPEQGLPILALICRLAPEQRNLETYWDALVQSLKPPEPKMAGYRCLFNQFDFTNWEIISGSWVVRKQSMTGAWAIIRYPERLASYILRICYRAPMNPNVEESPPSVWIHKSTTPEHWAGAEIILTGRYAGSVARLLPDPKYGEAVENGERPCRLLKESPYNSNDWNEIEIQVKIQSIAVKINGKTVFESLKGAFIEGWRGEEKKNFPGCIEIHANGGIEIKTVFLRKISSP